jgi:Predicted membrane protein (DUF2232)
MPMHILIGLGAGLISAIVFASATTGPVFMRFLLFLLTPLAIGLAALGWGQRSGMVAAITASALVALMTANPALGLMFAATQAGPILFLVHRANLYRDRPGDGNQPASREWYPTGQLVLWAAAISALVAIVALVAVSNGSIEGLQAQLTDQIEKSIKASLPQIDKQNALSPEDIATLTKVAVGFVPAGLAMSMMAGLLFSLWLAARIAASAGHLQRPWPDVAAMVFPAGTALALVASLIAAQLGGLFAVAGTAASGVLLFAYFLLGLAVVHYISRGNSWRPFLLWALYISLLFLNTVGILIVILFGLSETFLQLRRRAPGPD